MNRLGIACALLLAVGCDSPSPLAPAVSTTPQFAADVDLGFWSFAFPAEGLLFPPVSCLGGAQPTAFGGVTIRSRVITRPDGQVIEKWWTIELWPSYHLVIAGEEWWPIAHRARTGVIRYDAEGAMISNLGVGAVFTLRNQVTGAILDWPAHWSYQTNAHGDVVTDRVQQLCRIR